MLGLGVGFYKLAGNDYPIGGFAPDQIENLEMWLKLGNFTADFENASDGSAYSPPKTTGFLDGDRINKWIDLSGNGNHAVQTNNSFKPRVDTDIPGAVEWPSANSKFMDLESNSGNGFDINANTDFTAIVRFRALSTNQNALFGDSTGEFLRIVNNSRIRLKINNSATNRNFDLPSGTLQTDTFYTVMLVRSNGSTGTNEMYIKGGIYTDASGTQFTGSNLDDPSGPITVSNIGASANEQNEFHGWMKDVIIYNGTAVTAEQRELLFNYIESQ